MKTLIFLLLTLLVSGCGCNYYTKKLEQKGCIAKSAKTDTLYKELVKPQIITKDSTIWAVDTVYEAINICEEVIKTSTLPESTKKKFNKKKFNNCHDYSLMVSDSIDNYTATAYCVSGRLYLDMERKAKTDTLAIITNKNITEISDSFNRPWWLIPLVFFVFGLFVGFVIAKK